MKLSKIAIILSAISIFICIGAIIYGAVALKEGSPFFWSLLAVANLTMLITNIANLKRDKQIENQKEDKK